MLDIRNALYFKLPFLKKAPAFIGNSLTYLLGKILHQDEINTFIEEHKDYKAFDFNRAVIDHFSSGYMVSSDDILNIPQSGKVLIISNHPLGAMEALVLLDMVKSVRKDVKIVANELLMNIKPLIPLFLPVDNMNGRTARDSIRLIQNALKNEEAVIIFPAGEVSRMRKNGIKDGDWNRGFLSFAKRANAPILPILIKARNSWLFYSVSFVNKFLSSLMLPHEMFRKSKEPIRMSIGKMIPCSSYANGKIDDETLVKLFKKHLYLLARKKRKNIFKTIETIAPAQPKEELIEELSHSQLLGTTSDGKKIYLFENVGSSAVLNEIGRLREFTFRQVDEGSGKRKDIDKYDKYYKQLVLWDEKESEIVGAYRLGVGKDISQSMGKDGFYSSTLFNLSDNFIKLLPDSIELGRSFVQPKFWGTRALDYLWQGIGAYVRNHPEVKYLWGPVSLSDAYPKEAKEMILFFFEKYFAPKEVLASAKIPFIVSSEKKLALNELFCGGAYKEDFKILKENLSVYHLSVPTLYKQYAEVSGEGGTQFLAYNIDPDFNNCVDSLIVVEIDKILEAKRKRYMEA